MLLATCCLASGFALPVAAQATTVSLARSVDLLKARAGAQCHRAEQAVAVAQNDDDRALAKLLQGNVCDCFPAEMDKVASSHSGPDEIARDDLLKLLEQATDVCAARQFRQSAERMCLLDQARATEVSDPAALCACFAQGVQGLTDQAIGDASREAFQAFQARVAAKSEGRPVPPPVESAMDRINNACKAADRAAR